MGKTHIIVPEGYEVFLDGEVVSLPKTQVINNRWGGQTTRKIKGRILKPFLSGSGYFQVNCGKGFRADVHRLVAEKFCENPLNLLCVNHKDGDKLNNSSHNLEWVSHAGNSQHAASLGLVKGFYGPQKLVPSEELDKEFVEAYQKHGSAKAMASNGFYGCDRTTISKYIKSRNLPIKLKVNQHDVN